MAILILGIAIEKRRPVILGITLPFLLISGSSFSLKHLIFSILICVYLVIMLGLVRALTWGDCRIFLITSTSVIVIRYFVVLTTGSHYIAEILVLNFLVFIGAFVLLKDKISSVS